MNRKRRVASLKAESWSKELKGLTSSSSSSLSSSPSSSSSSSSLPSSNKRVLWRLKRTTLLPRGFFGAKTHQSRRRPQSPSSIALFNRRPLALFNCPLHLPSSIALFNRPVQSPSSIAVFNRPPHRPVQSPCSVAVFNRRSPRSQPLWLERRLVEALVTRVGRPRPAAVFCSFCTLCTLCAVSSCSAPWS